MSQKETDDVDQESEDQTLKKSKCLVQNGHKDDLSSVRFPIWDYDSDGLIQTMTDIIDESGIRTHWEIPHDSLKRFLLQIRSKYQDNPYHNFRHAFCVTQIVYSLLKTLSSDLKMDLDSWGVLIVAAIAHDVDHPGLTNGFLVKSSDSLCVLYGDISTLEYHHFTTLCNILHRRQNDIFINVLNRKYDLLRRIRELILVTDLAKQPDFIEMANAKLAQSQSLTAEETMKLMLKCADISNEVRPVNISQPIIHSLYEEMFEQGRLEKELNLPVTPGNEETLVSKEDQQIMFHKNFTLPLFRLLALAYPVTRVPYLSILESVAEKYNLQESSSYA